MNKKNGCCQGKKSAQAAPNCGFESMFFKPFFINEELPNNDPDPDVNLYQNRIPSLDTKCFVSNEAKGHFESFKSNFFSVLQLNIKSVSKTFEAFQSFSKSLSFQFSAICISETWCQPQEILNSNFELPGFNSIHQTRDYQWHFRKRIKLWKIKMYSSVRNNRDG